MKRQALAIAVSGAVFVLALAAWAAPGKNKDEAQILSLVRQWEVAFKAKDVAALMKLYVPGNELVAFDVVPPRQYVGQDAYRKDYEELFAALEGPLTLEVTDLSITTDRTLAYSRAIDRITGTMKGGVKLDVTLRVTDVYRKVDGRWLIVHEHVSVPVDLATGQADLQSKP